MTQIFVLLTSSRMCNLSTIHHYHVYSSRLAFYPIALQLYIHIGEKTERVLHVVVTFTIFRIATWRLAGLLILQLLGKINVAANILSFDSMGAISNGRMIVIFQFYFAVNWYYFQKLFVTVYDLLLLPYHFL